MTATANTQEGATEYREPVVPLTGEFYLMPEKLPGERRRKNPKLRVDLTPSSVAGKTLSEGYFETVSSKQWAKITMGVRHRAGWKCEICGVPEGHEGKPLECDEVWSYNDDKKTQTLVGFEALCRSCHGFKHQKGEMRPTGKMAQHVMAVSGWSIDEANKKVRAAVNKKNSRDNIDYIHQDISVIEKFLNKEPQSYPVSRGRLGRDVVLTEEELELDDNKLFEILQRNAFKTLLESEISNDKFVLYEKMADVESIKGKRVIEFYHPETGEKLAYVSKKDDVPFGRIDVADEESVAAFNEWFEVNYPDHMRKKLELQTEVFGPETPEYQEAFAGFEDELNDPEVLKPAYLSFTKPVLLDVPDPTKVSLIFLEATLDFKNDAVISADTGEAIPGAIIDPDIHRLGNFNYADNNATKQALVEQLPDEFRKFVKLTDADLN